MMSITSATNEPTVCMCASCAGASCTCGCQTPSADPPTACQCGPACNCAPVCTCAVA